MRSIAEQEVRDAVVARLRKLRPQARICHEVNSAGSGSNRFDVVAVDRAEIIAVEIKSEKDKLDRATDQIEAMKRVSSHVILAMHECHLEERETNSDAAHYGKLDGKHYLRDLPATLLNHRYGIIHWVYPERERGRYSLSVGRWEPPQERYEAALPGDALGMLWRDELAVLCGSLRVAVPKRANMTDMVRALRWHATGKELTLGICSALRRRPFAEADAPMTGSARTLEMAQ